MRMMRRRVASNCSLKTLWDASLGVAPGSTAAAAELLKLPAKARNGRCMSPSKPA
jgi:hypothetical protein